MRLSLSPLVPWKLATHQKKITARMNLTASVEGRQVERRVAEGTQKIIFIIREKTRNGREREKRNFQRSEKIAEFSLDFFR